MPWDPLEERLQRLENGPYLCPNCGRAWNNPSSADLCCDPPEVTPKENHRGTF